MFKNIERKQALIDEKQHHVEAIAKKKRIQSSSKNKMTNESNKIFTSWFMKKLNEKNKSGSLDSNQSVNRSNTLMNSYLKALKDIQTKFENDTPHQMKLEDILSSVIKKDSQSNIFHSISDISFDLSKNSLLFSKNQANRDNDLNPRMDFQKNLVHKKEEQNVEIKVVSNANNNTSKNNKECKIISYIRNRNKLQSQGLTSTNRGSNPSADKEPDKPKIMNESPANVKIKVKKMKLLHNSKAKIEINNSNKGNLKSKDLLLMDNFKTAGLASKEISKKDEEFLSNRETFISSDNKKLNNAYYKQPSIKDMKRTLSIPEIRPNFIKEATIKAEKARNDINRNKFNNINSNQSRKKEIQGNKNPFSNRARSLDRNEHNVGMAENRNCENKTNFYPHSNKKNSHPTISSTPIIKKVKEPELKEINKLNFHINPLSVRSINPTNEISPYLQGNIVGKINPKNNANGRKKNSASLESFLKRQSTEIAIAQNIKVNNRDEYLIKRENFQRKMSNPLDIIKLIPYVTNITKKEKQKYMNQERFISDKVPKINNPLQKIGKTTNKIQRHSSAPSIIQKFH